MGRRLVNDALINLVIPTALSIVIGECTEISPWLARRILRLGARLLGNPEATERYEAEWIALLDERPGKLLKLVFACWIALRGTWTLRAINRPIVSAPEPPPDQADAPRPDEPQRPPAHGSRYERPRTRPRPAPRPQGVVVRSHYRRRSRSGRSSQRPPNLIAVALVIVAVWIYHLITTTDSFGGLLTAVASLSSVTMLTWFYCARTMNRVRSRLAAASLRKEDWALRVRRVPDGAFRRVKGALAEGEVVHIVVPGDGGGRFLRVIDIPPFSGLAVVVRPRRRPQS